MKFLTGYEFNFDFELFTPVINGQTISYQFAYAAKGLVLPAAMGGMSLVAEKQLPVAGVVRNVKDIAGVNMLVVNDLPYDMYVHSATPELLHSKIIGWRHILRKDQPRDFEDMLTQLAAVN